MTFPEKMNTSKVVSSLPRREEIRSCRSDKQTYIFVFFDISLTALISDDFCAIISLLTESTFANDDVLTIYFASAPQVAGLKKVEHANPEDLDEEFGGEDEEDPEDEGGAAGLEAVLVWTFPWTSCRG